MKGWRGIGRRGAVLALLGLIYALVGFSYLMVSPSETQQEALQVALMIAPMPVWGVVWLFVGSAALLAAGFARSYPKVDTRGYVGLGGLSTLWCATYLGSAIGFGVERAWLGAVVWAAMAGMLMIVAGWPEDTSRDGYQR